VRVLGCVAIVLIAACGDAPKPEAAKAPVLEVDTGHVDLSGMKANLPPPSADTLTAMKPFAAKTYPDAPTPLMDAAERESGISRFCYQEYGQKSDPKLVGAVALIVSVDMNVIQNVRLGAEDWSSKAGRGVNDCLVQKARQAWKLLPGENVAEGKYVVQLRFKPS
jgi:hypothetical protein